MILSDVTRSKQAQAGRTKEAAARLAAAFIPGVYGKISMVSTEEESHNINSFREVPEAKFQYKVNVEKGSSISGNMYVIQDQYLKKYQADKPSDSMYIGNYHYFTALFSSSFCSC